MLLARIWSGSIGRKGTKMLAAMTLNMLPKLLDAPMRTYLMMFENTFRPSRTPSSRTRSDRSSRIMSAEAFATSTAVSTLMPTSAAWSAGASLMPSPRKPTVCPRDWSAVMIRSLCAGETRAKSVAPSAAASSSASVIFSTSSPRRTTSVQRPTSLQTLRATRSLSPVTTFTETPWPSSASMAAFADSFGGSRNAA